MKTAGADARISGRIIRVTLRDNGFRMASFTARADRVRGCTRGSVVDCRPRKQSDRDWPGIRSRPSTTCGRYSCPKPRRSPVGVAPGTSDMGPGCWPARYPRSARIRRPRCCPTGASPRGSDAPLADLRESGADGMRNCPPRVQDVRGVMPSRVQRTAVRNPRIGRRDGRHQRPDER